MKRWLCVLLGFGILSTNVCAEEIILKSGRTLNVTIVERSADYIQVDAGIGIPVTYYYDEIDQIDGLVINSEYRQQADDVRLRRAEAEAKGESFVPEQVEYVPSYVSHGERRQKKMPSWASMAMSGVFIGFILVLWLVLYFLFCIPLYMIAKKVGVNSPWMAFIPLLQLYTLVKSGGLPGWWLLLLFIPLVNMVISVIIWVKIAEQCGKPTWLGLLMIIPFVNIVLPWYLALSKKEGV